MFLYGLLNKKHYFWSSCFIPCPIFPSQVLILSVSITNTLDSYIAVVLRDMLRCFLLEKQKQKTLSTHFLLWNEYYYKVSNLKNCFNKNTI